MQKLAVKLISSVFAALLTSSVFAQYEEFYCGLDLCLVPLRLSCEEMINQYDFQGSCCSMETVNETLGCRITVGAAGNCFWYPKCGECDPLDDQIQCNILYSTATDSICPESDFDPLASFNETETTCPPVAAPSSPESLAPVASCATMDHRLFGFVSTALVFVASSVFVA